jgi:hypothetical protein
MCALAPSGLEWFFMAEDLALFLRAVETLGLPATMGIVGLLAWYFERRQNIVLQGKLLELATEQIAAAVRVEAAVAAISQVVASRKR